MFAVESLQKLPLPLCLILEVKCYFLSKLSPTGNNKSANFRKAYDYNLV